MSKKCENPQNKILETLVQLLWCAAAQGLKPLRLPRAKPAGTWVGVSACIYDSNSLGDRVEEGRRSERRHARTGERISARIHVANSH